MTTRAAVGVLAATATSGFLLLSGPVWGQTAGDFVPDCATGVLSYPPGGSGGATVSDSAPLPGGAVVASTPAGSFTPGSSVTVTFDDPRTVLAPTVAAQDGSATATLEVPAGTAPGVHVVRFDGTRDGATRIVAVCLSVQTAGVPIAGATQQPASRPTPAPGESPAARPTPAPAESPVARPIQGIDQEPVQNASPLPFSLPFTGSVEMVAVTGLGLGLLAAGAGAVVLARRRRSVPA